MLRGFFLALKMKNLNLKALPVQRMNIVEMGTIDGGRRLGMFQRSVLGGMYILAFPIMIPIDVAWMKLSREWTIPIARFIFSTG